MIETDIISNTWKRKLKGISANVFKFQMIKPLPSVWTEANIILPESTTRYPGPFRYRLTPYAVEIVNLAHSDNPTRSAAICKSSQCGITAGVVIPVICYTIDVDPDPILFTAADKIMAGRTIKERLDPILWASKLDHRIRPNAIKKQNRRTGDTEFSKEFAGGTLTAAGTSNPDTFRFYSAKKVLADDFDTAPQEVGQEGDITKLMQGRQKMYGDSALTYYISTPTVTATSQIWKQYLKGTMKKWHWACPECGEYFPVEFSVKMDDGSYAGLTWELDEHKKLKPETIHYRTQCCGKGKLYYKDKLKLNSTGTWIATNPNPTKFFESYLLNDLIIPPGFDSWEKVVEEWLEACPPGGQININKLKAFNNQRLGLPFEEIGRELNVSALMKNTRLYLPGIVPDKTCEEDGNGKIIMLTLSCDINGIMDSQVEDVRLDWEILAHAQTGATYSVDHGSIGTWKRGRDRNAAEKLEEENRMKWTLSHNSFTMVDGLRVSNSVWDSFEEIVRGIYPLESESEVGTRDILVTAIDTGFGEKYAMQFILKMQGEGYNVFGVKGKVDNNYRPIQRDTNPVRRSSEKPKQLYIVEVNQLKDDLSQMMELREGEGSSQPSGFMNYPEPNNGKYTMNEYFKHYEGERRVEVKNPKNADEVIGYRWDKKHSGSQNHFWDVRVYNLAAPLIYLDLLRHSDSRYKFLTWEEFIMMVT
jgi:phage terminase large subunit GpA-like protein